MDQAEILTSIATAVMALVGALIGVWLGDFIARRAETRMENRETLRLRREAVANLIVALNQAFDGTKSILDDWANAVEDHPRDRGRLPNADKALPKQHKVLWSTAFERFAETWVIFPWEAGGTGNLCQGPTIAKTSTIRARAGTRSPPCLA